MPTELPDAPKQELTPEQKRGCAWFFILTVLCVGAGGIYSWSGRETKQCERGDLGSCPDTMKPRYIDGNCICVVVPSGRGDR